MPGYQHRPRSRKHAQPIAVASAVVVAGNRARARSADSHQTRRGRRVYLPDFRQLGKPAQETQE